MEQEGQDFRWFYQIFLENNMDPFKICQILTAGILINQKQNSQSYNQEINSQDEQKNQEEFKEQIKKQILEKKQKFEEILNSVNKFYTHVQQQKNVEHEIVCILLQNSLEFHRSVASHGTNYTVVSLIDIGFSPIKSEKQVQLQNLIRKQFQKYQNDEKHEEYFFLLLSNAYLNIQKEQYDNAKILLDELSKHYNLDSLKENICNESKQRNFIIGFIESIHTYQALSFLYSNQQDDLLNEINILKQLDEHVIDQNQKNRIQNHLELFQVHYNFITQNLDLSQKHLELLGENLEQSLILFFQNQNNQLLSHIETIYYNIFGSQLFKVFKILQEFEIQNKTTTVSISKLKDLFENFKKQEADQPYRYGNGLILILSVIYTILLRLGKQYNEAIKHMNLIFQICKQTKTNFSNFLELFFKYNRLICYLYEITSSPQKLDSSYQFVGRISQTNCNNIFEYTKGNQSYILKIQIPKNENDQQKQNYYKFQSLNEACLQMLLNHPNIQNVDSVVALQNGIAIIQKKQGQNLEEILKRGIDQEKAMGYVLKIINAFCYMHQLNVIHSDFKLKNVVTLLEDETKIKIIDFGFSQKKLFNKYFKPQGYTKGLAAKELFKQNIYTFESDIYSIGLSIDQLLQNNEFCISNQLRQLIDLMQSEELKNRCTIEEAAHKFKLEMVIFQLFQQIQINQQENLSSQHQQEIFKEFANSLHFLYQKFKQFHYSVFSVVQKEENERIYEQFLLENPKYDIKAVIQAIKNLIQQKNENFLESMRNSDDIKLFILKLLNFELNQNQDQTQQLEQFFQQPNQQKYFQQEEIDNLISDINVENNKQNDNQQFMKEIEERLDQIKYSNQIELSHRDEYKNLIHKIELLLNQLVDQVSQEQEDSKKQVNSQQQSQPQSSTLSHETIFIQDSFICKVRVGSCQRNSSKNIQEIKRISQLQNVSQAQNNYPSSSYNISILNYESNNIHQDQQSNQFNNRSTGQSNEMSIESIQNNSNSNQYASFLSQDSDKHL